MFHVGVINQKIFHLANYSVCDIGWLPGYSDAVIVGREAAGCCGSHTAMLPLPR